MRTALCTAIGLAALVAGVPAVAVEDSRAVDHGTSAGTGNEAEELQTLQGAGSNTPVFVAVPTGRVSVGHRLVDGEPVYVRRTKASGGMTVVEVSTAPFMPVSPANPAAAGQLLVRSDQPASW